MVRLGPEVKMRNGASQNIGRPLRVVSFGFQPKPLAEIEALVEREGARGADLLILPETFLGQQEPPETLDGPAIAAMSRLAAKHRHYIISPIYRRDGDQRFNSAVIIDRCGQVAGIYDKMYPYWPEFDVTPPVRPGRAIPVFQTDFGRIGILICFDINFPEVWRQLAEQGAELAVWPSAYSGGALLQAHARNHHYYIVTATQSCNCLVYDITGELLLDEQNAGLNISRITLDLDRGLYHFNFNDDKLEKLLHERGEDIVMEQRLEREEWFVLKARRPGVSARALAREYGLEELRDYQERSRREIDRRRG